jgi:hypothetical protein
MILSPYSFLEKFWHSLWKLCIEAETDSYLSDVWHWIFNLETQNFAEFQELSHKIVKNVDVLNCEVLKWVI